MMHNSVSFLIKKKSLRGSARDSCATGGSLITTHRAWSCIVYYILSLILDGVQYDVQYFKHHLKYLRGSPVGSPQTDAQILAKNIPFNIQ